MIFKRELANIRASFNACLKPRRYLDVTQSSIFNCHKNVPSNRNKNHSRLASCKSTEFIKSGVNWLVAFKNL